MSPHHSEQPDTEPVLVMAHPGPEPAGYALAGAGAPMAYPAGTPAPYPYEIREPGRFASFVSRTAQRMPAWVAPAGLAVMVAGGVAYTLLMDPTAAGAASAPTCVMKLFTGFDCPGCGGTRAAWYMMHGDLAAAARHHAPLVFAAPFLAYAYVVWALGTVTKRIRLPRITISTTAIMGFLAAWAVFSVLRNLPWAPFTWFFV